MDLIISQVNISKSIGFMRKSNKYRQILTNDVYV